MRNCGFGPQDRHSPGLPPQTGSRSRKGIRSAGPTTGARQGRRNSRGRVAPIAGVNCIIADLFCRVPPHVRLVQDRRPTARSSTSFSPRFQSLQTEPRRRVPPGLGAETLSQSVVLDQRADRLGQPGRHGRAGGEHGHVVLPQEARFRRPSTTPCRSGRERSGRCGRVRRTRGSPSRPMRSPPGRAPSPAAPRRRGCGRPAATNTCDGPHQLVHFLGRAKSGRSRAPSIFPGCVGSGASVRAAGCAASAAHADSAHARSQMHRSTSSPPRRKKLTGSWCHEQVKSRSRRSAPRGPDRRAAGPCRRGCRPSWRR